MKAAPLAHPHVEGEPSAEPPNPVLVDLLLPPVLLPEDDVVLGWDGMDHGVLEVPQIVPGPDGAYYSSIPPHQLYESAYFDRDGYLAAGFNPPLPPPYNPVAEDADMEGVPGLTPGRAQSRSPGHSQAGNGSR